MSVTDLQGAGPDAPVAPGGEREAAKQKLRRASASLRRSAERYRDVTQRQAADMQARAREMVRDRPMTTMGAAVGGALVAGVLLGFFIGQAMATTTVEIEEL
jgi:ElaB/YqjD/DUF883 family membrane-anchored ribosome-binding protein